MSHESWVTWVLGNGSNALFDGLVRRELQNVSVRQNPLRQNPLYKVKLRKAFNSSVSDLSGYIFKHAYTERCHKWSLCAS